MNAKYDRDCWACINIIRHESKPALYNAKNLKLFFYEVIRAKSESYLSCYTLFLIIYNI